MPEIIINGSEGRIEGRYHHSEQKGAPVVLVLHPHPLYGGTMNNKIVYRLYHIFAQNGFSVLRFNFRGVGKSQENTAMVSVNYLTRQQRLTGCNYRIQMHLPAGSAGFSFRGMDCVAVIDAPPGN